MTQLLAAAPMLAAEFTNRDLLMLAIPGLAYVVFAFIGVGREPFLWAIALALAGLPVYALLRLRSGSRIRSAGADVLAPPNHKH